MLQRNLSEERTAKEFSGKNESVKERLAIYKIRIR